MVESYLRGHKIEFKKNQWVYSDNKKPTAKFYKSRPCGKCGKHRTKDDNDSCLQTLPNVTNACCGHGNDEEAYIRFLYINEVRGINAVNVINILKEG